MGCMTLQSYFCMDHAAKRFEETLVDGIQLYREEFSQAYSYTYDDVGNITSITQGTTSIGYEYDAANRLTRENNQVTNQTVTYEYDDFGNIQNRKVYAYTTGTLGSPSSTVNYAYTNSAWGDQLTSYNGQTITYDSMGNPTTYRGYTMTWRGKQLAGFTNGTKTVSFEYNEDGLRQQKTYNDVVTDYYYNGSVLIGMQRGTAKERFSYDASGNVVSVNHNGTEYYYLRNAQGDIVKLIDANGVSVVEYTYDTWGKKVSTTGSLAGSLGLVQPFRYRGYVYDWETGFYYLQSRYYDPTTGRFISADVMLSTGQGVLGHNCYAYCGDNPIMRVDPNGRFWIAVLVGVIAVGLLCTVGCSNQTDNEPTPSPTAEITPYVEEVTLAVEEPTQTILLLTDEEKIFVATVCGEAIGENEMAWKAVAHVIMNRIGYKEWSQCKTATDVITQPSQFNGYQSPQYNNCMDYLNNRDGKNTKYEQVIAAVIPIYLKQEEDFTNKAVLFYSPKSMKNGSVPNWAKKSIVEEVVIGGIDFNSFRFYRYK